MKIVHIADTHLGLAACTRLDPESGMNLRGEADLREFPRLAIDVIIRERPDAIVQAGDLFDTVKPKTPQANSTFPCPGHVYLPLRKTVARTGPLFCRFKWPLFCPDLKNNLKLPIFPWAWTLFPVEPKKGIAGLPVRGRIGLVWDTVFFGA
jgi:hypothetical protein